MISPITQCLAQQDTLNYDPATGNYVIRYVGRADTLVTVKDKRTGKSVKKSVTVADADWLTRYTEFMAKFKLFFVDEKQTVPDPETKGIRFPHFEWKGN